MSKRAANKTNAAHTASDHTAIGHEYRDVSTGWTIFSAAVVAAIVIGCCIAGRWVFAQLQEPAELRSVTSANGEGLVLPPAPRLEGIEMMTAAQQADEPALPNVQTETEQLQSYGWVSQDRRTVHIPIQQAMKIVAEKGLSAIHPAPPPSTNSSSSQPNRSSS
jgi:hypothetical protein